MFRFLVRRWQLSATAAVLDLGLPGRFPGGTPEGFLGGVPVRIPGHILVGIQGRISENSGRNSKNPEGNFQRISMRIPIRNIRNNHKSTYNRNSGIPERTLEENQEAIPKEIT